MNMHGRNDSPTRLAGPLVYGEQRRTAGRVARSGAVLSAVGRAALICIALAISACAVGCCNGEMKPFDVSVSLHDSLKDTRGVLPAVEVDVVAVNNADLPTWEQKSMTEYFSPGDTLRAAADKYVFRLGEDHKSETLSKDGAAGKKLWDDWKKQGAMNLLILSSYPSPQPDLPGDQDPRRRTLPLDCARWGDEKELKFQIKSSGLTVLTPPKPPKQ